LIVEQKWKKKENWKKDKAIDVNQYMATI